MNERVIKRTESIRELPDKWLNETTGRYHKTATFALRAAQRRGKEMVRGNPGMVVIQTITWTPTTRIGTAIVRAIS